MDGWMDWSVVSHFYTDSVHQMTPMNIMGNVNEPFLSTNRFEVSFSTNVPKYLLELSISGESTN